MPETNDVSSNSVGDRVVPPQLTPFQPGHPKTGGKQKGYKSTKTVLRELLQKISTKRDGEDITYQQALLYKQLDKALADGDLATVRFVLEQAGDLMVTPTVSPIDPGNNFYNIETFKQIINNKDFLDAEDEVLLEEATVVDVTPDMNNNHATSEPGTDVPNHQE